MARSRQKRRFTGRGLERSGSPVRDVDELTNRPRRLTKRGAASATASSISVATHWCGASDGTGIVHGGPRLGFAVLIADISRVRDDN